MPSLVDLRLASFGCEGAITSRGDARLPSVVNQTLGEGSAAVVEGVSSHVSALKGRFHGPRVLRLAFGGCVWCVVYGVSDCVCARSLTCSSWGGAFDVAPVVAAAHESLYMELYMYCESSCLLEAAAALGVWRLFYI